MVKSSNSNKVGKMTSDALAVSNPALENLREHLSSPRLKAKTTIVTYLETARRFLSVLGKAQEPTYSDFRRYFMRRRRQGISMRSRRKEFFHLKKLAVANGWFWPFAAEDTSEIIQGQKREAKKVLATVGESVGKHNPALERLVEALSSRLRSPATIASYLITGARFLASLNDNQTPTESEFRRYFIKRRQQGISERTLLKEFSHLRKLASANNWSWPFGADDAPYQEEEQKSLALSQGEVERLIGAQAKLSQGESFYLAVATTWIVRREALSRIKKRDFDGDVFTIRYSKHGGRVKHLIPEALKPIFANYRPKGRSPSAMSEMFKRIWVKAGLESREKLGWDSIRNRLSSLLKDRRLPQNNLSPSLLNDYVAGQKMTSARPAEKDNSGDYLHPEILDTDPYGLDKVIYSVHPFLPLWQEKR